MASAIVILAIVVFAGGVLIGVIGALALGIGREASRYPLTDTAPGWRGAYARRLHGAGHRHLNGPLSR